jgi:proton-translocating NADH-quinone oxidoreductase chain L
MSLFLLIVFIPFLNFLTIIIFGSYLGNKGSAYLATTNLGITFLLALFIFMTTLGVKDLTIIRLFPWVTLGDFNVWWDFYFDFLTIMMFLVVSFISFLVHLYSISYMSEDPFQSSFMSYLSLFTFFMLMLVSSGNFFQLFLGWEGVGLCSFLLISFWSDRVYAVGSAIKAIVLNRIGDIGLLLAIVFIYIEFGTVDFINVFMLSNTFTKTYSLLGYEVEYFNLVALCLLLAAVGKSSQYLLHGWLPDAMEGPTPVSALIHAATMVTAGVFLLVRCSSIFVNAPRVLCVVAVIGFLTCIFGAFTGTRVYDLKKMIAYSTTSHLGYMFMACGLLANGIAVFHLLVHACFKALLFLAAGSVIHSFSNEQDVRKMSGLDIRLPITVMSLVIGSSSMNGIFGLSGAISKDNILFMDFFGNSYMRFVGFGLLLCSIFYGSLYAARITSFFFDSLFVASKEKIRAVYESDYFILIPFILLSFLSVYVGFFFENFFKDDYSTIWLGRRFYFHDNYNLSFGEYNHASLFFKTFGTILSDEDLALLVENVAAFGSFFAIYIYKVKQNYVHLEYFKDKFKVYYIKDMFSYFYVYTERRSMTDRLYNKFFAFMEFRNAKVYFFDYFEKGFLELLGPQGIVSLLSKMSRFFSYITTGFIHNYLFFSLIFFFFLFLAINNMIYLSVYFFISFFFLILINFKK